MLLKTDEPPRHPRPAAHLGQSLSPGPAAFSYLEPGKKKKKIHNCFMRAKWCS